MALGSRSAPSQATLTGDDLSLKPPSDVSQYNLAGLAAARARGRTGGRKPKMTPELIHKAQRMYDVRQFTMAEIANSCGVAPVTIYGNIRTDHAAARGHRTTAGVTG